MEKIEVTRISYTAKELLAKLGLVDCGLSTVYMDLRRLGESGETWVVVEVKEPPRAPSLP